MKKPGEFKAAKTRHRRRQEIQDAITAARSGNTVELQLHGEARWQIGPASQGTEFGLYLVRAKGNKLLISRIIDRDGGMKVLMEDGSLLHVHEKDLLATATPINDEARRYLR